MKTITPKDVQQRICQVPAGTVSVEVRLVDKHGRETSSGSVPIDADLEGRIMLEAIRL